jgi:hypothetical protein
MLHGGLIEELLLAGSSHSETIILMDVNVRARPNAERYSLTGFYSDPNYSPQLFSDQDVEATGENLLTVTFPVKRRA